MNLSDEVIHHIAGIKEAKRAWQELNKVFGNETKNSKINLLMQFYKLDLENNGTMTQHINKFKAIKQQLCAIDKNVDEDEAIAVLLKSVDKEPYEGLVATLMNVPTTKLHDVESALLEHETKVKGKQSTPPGEVALYTRGGRTTSRGSGQERGQAPSRTTCDYCGIQGHIERFCRNRGKPQCKYCNKFGHAMNQIVGLQIM